MPGWGHSREEVEHGKGGRAHRRNPRHGRARPPASQAGGGGTSLPRDPVPRVSIHEVAFVKWRRNREPGMVTVGRRAWTNPRSVHRGRIRIRGQPGRLCGASFEATLVEPINPLSRLCTAAELFPEAELSTKTCTSLMKDVANVCGPECKWRAFCRSGSKATNQANAVLNKLCSVSLP